MFDKIIVLTQHKLSFFSHNGDASVIREYLQGEERQDITDDSKESLTRVFDYVKKSQLLQGCNRVRVMYDEELDPNMLNSLVDCIKEKAEVKSYEVIQFKTMLPELLLKSVSTEIISPLQVQLCDCAYRIVINDSTLIINRQNDPQSANEFIWDDEALVSLTITDSYPSLNTYMIEELQAKVRKLKEANAAKTQENRNIREDLKKTKQELVLRTMAHDACLKELSVFKDKDQKERERIVFRAYDIPKLKEYISHKDGTDLGMFLLGLVRMQTGHDLVMLIAKRMVSPDELVIKNQPIFQFIVDEDNLTGLGTYKFIVKAKRSGRIYCFSKSLGKTMICRLTNLVANLVEKNTDDQNHYNPVLFVIADENDTVPEIRQWCHEQGFDIYE